MCGTVQNQNCSFFVVILDSNFASIINCKWRHSNISMHVQFKKYTVEIYEMASLQRIYFIMADTPSCLTCLTHTHTAAWLLVFCTYEGLISGAELLWAAVIRVDSARTTLLHASTAQLGRKAMFSSITHFCTSASQFVFTQSKHDLSSAVGKS